MIRFQSLSRTVLVPVAAIIIYYLLWGQYVDSDLPLIIFCLAVLMGVLSWIFQKEIDRWYWKRRPPRLDNRLLAWLDRYSAYFKILDTESKSKFVDRLAVFIHSKDFTKKSQRDFHLPEDIKLLIAHEFIRLTMCREEYLFAMFPRIVVYDHPFVSPSYPELHSVEWEENDGVVILSLEQVLDGFRLHTEHFNVLLFAAINVFLKQYPRLEYPNLSHLTIGMISQTLSWNESSLYQSTGLTYLSTLALFIYTYFEHREITLQYWPSEYAQLHKIFGDISIKMK